MLRLRLIAFIASLGLVPSVALADAVGPPPSMCPEGSTAVDFCHGPPTCEIAECSGDADCGPGQACAPQELCVAEHCCSGRCCAMDCGSEPTRYDHIAGPCSTGGTCSGFGESCQTRRVCVDAAGVDAGSDDLDAGDPVTDAGSEDDDAGSEGMDAGGSSGMDAASPGVDGGDEAGTSDGGCGCGVAERPAVPGEIWLLVALATLGVRRLRA